MTNFKSRFVTAIATGAVLVSSVAPAFAADITITQNGRDSDNTAVVTSTNVNTAVQTNVANVNNNTVVNSNTGGNNANDNIGGNVHLKSGDATSNVNVQTNANNNVLHQDACCANGGPSVEIGRNGRDTTNTVGVTQANITTAAQTNVANVNNNTVVNSNTGNNNTNDNIDGDVHSTSGNVETNVGVKTTVNSNVAQIGGGANLPGNNGISAMIVENGRDSTNAIVLGVVNSATVAQTNVANVNNNTAVNSNTGDNDANDNIGGNVHLVSGNAKTNIAVDTMANFNAAAVEACGCDMTLNAKIGQNGRDTTNTIGATLSNAQAAFQTSALNGNNNSVVNANTGNNNANDNGAPTNGDPSVTSGDAPATVNVKTSGNSNVVGTGLTLPWANNSQVQLSFNMNAWFTWLAGLGSISI